jgi:hypothetical protein
MTWEVTAKGGKNAKILPPFLVFKNEKESFPMRGVVVPPGTSYRTQKKGN